MRPKVSNSSPEKARRPAADVIDAVLENMRQNLEPLKYSILTPSRYLIYLHPAEYTRLEGIVAILREQTIRALSEEVASRNKHSALQNYARRILGNRRPHIENPGGDWTVEFLPDPDGELAEGDIVVDSELLLPAVAELTIGERTRIVRTVHSGHQITSHDGPAQAAGAQPSAKIVYEDASGRHSYDLNDSVTIGRGGKAHPVDIRIVSSVDVSREHARIRRDAQGRFFLIDLSALGTTVNGRPIPRGYHEVDGVKRENGNETLLPDQARIGLADTVYLSFVRVRS